MQRPDIEGIREHCVVWERKQWLRVLDYCLYLEGRINDLHLGCEVEDERTANDAYEVKPFPHEYGEPL